MREVLKQNLHNEKNNLKELLSNFKYQLDSGISDSEILAYRDAIHNSIGNYRNWYYRIYNDFGEELSEETIQEDMELEGY